MPQMITAHFDGKVLVPDEVVELRGPPVATTHRTDQFRDPAIRRLVKPESRSSLRSLRLGGTA